MKRPDALKVFYGLEFFDSIGLHAAFTVWAVYLVQDVGANPLQLVLLGTVSEIAIFLFEVPTGVVADTYSRRLSIIIGLCSPALRSWSPGSSRSTGSSSPRPSCAGSRARF